MMVKIFSIYIITVKTYKILIVLPMCYCEKLSLIF